MKYQYATAADLAVDEDFVQWVKAPTPEADLFWENWLQRNPYQYELVEEARQIVLLLSQDGDELKDGELDLMWQHLHRKIRAETPGRVGRSDSAVTGFWQRNRILAVAASVSLLFLLAIGFVYSSMRVSTVAYATAFGETRTIQLPDGSVAVLNGNSHISFPEKWSATASRNVQLKGEAFFEVTRKQNKQKFVVETRDGMRIEVLGTAFDVSSRGSRNRIVLASGKVRLNYAQGDIEKQLIMKPGELVEVEGNTAGFTRKNVRAELYTSWKDDKVIFEDTSLQEIAGMLEEVYGVKVTIKEAALGEMKLTAYLDERGVENILATVSETLGVTIKKQNQEITISNTNK